MNDVDDRPMCQTVFDFIDLRTNCFKHPDSCPLVQNPHYQPENVGPEPKTQSLNPTEPNNFITSHPATSETQPEDPSPNLNPKGDPPTEITSELPPSVAADQLPHADQFFNAAQLPEANNQIPAPESIPPAASPVSQDQDILEGQDESWPLTGPSKRSVAPRPPRKSFIA